MKHGITGGVTSYRPNQRHELGWIRTWLVMASNVSRSRELIWQLFKRDFLAGYRKSFLGLTWILLSPIMGIVSWVFLTRTGMLNPGHTSVPYPVYVLVGSSMWGGFMGIYNSARQTLAAGSGFIMQVNYPHETLLFKEVAQYLASFVLTFVTIVVVMLAYGVTPSWKIALLPVVLLPLFLLGVALGLIFSMVAVVAVDVNKAVNAALMLLMWATPVVYSRDVHSEFAKTVIKWNPLTYLVCSARDIVLVGSLYEATAYYICSVGAAVLFLLAWRLFYVSEDALVERMI